LYNLWLENAENKLFDNLFFVYADQNKQPLGLMTARFDLSNQTATVGLFAVDENFHGRGIGRKLLNFLEGFCIENSISTIHIPTQLENHNSNAFYKKMGYSPVEVKYIYHYWK
jgi:dTDP-4-amino-4,6-dideoxy-D-galactose acyltransferase